MIDSSYCVLGSRLERENIHLHTLTTTFWLAVVGELRLDLKQKKKKKKMSRKMFIVAIWFKSPETSNSIMKYCLRTKIFNGASVN